jgi:hypothetical protein
MSLEALLREAVEMGGREVRLEPARKITIVTDDGEREVRGPDVTPQLISQVVGPVVPPEARAALAGGHAEWTLRHRELGSIRVGAGPRIVLLPAARARPVADLGEPPMVRHDGDMKSMPRRGVMSAADVERVLMPIAPERNRDEFARRRDTDFAYEIDGLSRFRCNFFVDAKRCSISASWPRDWCWSTGRPARASRPRSAR